MTEREELTEARTVVGCALVLVAALIVILTLTYLGLFPHYH